MARRAPEAVGNTNVPGIDGPGPATQNAVLTTRRARRVLRRSILIVVLIVPIANPLPHVPEHVLQPEAVGPLFTYLMHPVAVVLEPL